VANVKDLFYHGTRQQIRRVLEAMGPDRISQGVTAFETGASNWSACFFARAYPEVNLNIGDPELKIAQLLDMGTNKVPMRIVYRTFDSMSTVMTRKGLLDIIHGFLDEKRDPEVQEAINELMANTKYEGVEDKPIDFSVCAVTQQMQEPWASRDWSPGEDPRD
jgi:hypothetical protein